MRKLSTLLVVMVMLAVLVPATAAQDDMMMEGVNVIVTLEPTPLAENAGLQDISGWAHVVSDAATVHIMIDHMGTALPEGSVLEGWLVDAGLNGGPGMTNVTDDDEVYGTSFGDAAFDTSVEAAPYALSTGVLADNGEGAWEVKFEIPGYNFSPYDAVVITLESDGDSQDGFDPRPGTPVFAGAIAEGTPPEDDMSGDNMAGDDMGGNDMSGDDMAGDDMMMGEGVAVTLEATPLAENAGLSGITGTATVWSESATIEITIDLDHAMLPEGTVLEGWVVDAGLDGGPGMTNVTDDDEAYGTSFGDADFDMLVESAPYALSTGVVHEDMDMMGMLTLTFHVPGYNFSPYDAVVITLESDGDSHDGFDPRPGTPVLAGAIGGM